MKQMLKCKRDHLFKDIILFQNINDSCFLKNFSQTKRIKKQSNAIVLMGGNSVIGLLRIPLDCAFKAKAGTLKIEHQFEKRPCVILHPSIPCLPMFRRTLENY